KMSQLERVLTAEESKVFNGSGTMRPAFTFKSAGWARAIKGKNRAEVQKLRDERDGERLALIDWIRKGANKEAYENDSYPLPEELATHPITAEFLEAAGDGPPVVKIQSLVSKRCVRCHAPGKGVPGEFPLDTYDDLSVYCEKEVGAGMSLTKLAQSTHVHLLGFCMLFCMTGVIFSLTSYPGWIRGALAPFTLVAQVVDISFWWLGRADPLLAQAIMVTGALVGLGLLVHILGSLFDMFGKAGRAVILILLLAALAAGVLANTQVVGPYLERERMAPEIRDINKALSRD